MERVAIDALEASAYGDDATRRAVSDALGAKHVAVNHYRIPPSDGFPGGLHAHADQEEVFVVLSGEATFEWLGPEREEAREIAVGEGEVVRFPPGEYKSGRNDGDADLVALALGAPRDSEDASVPLACPECGHGDLRPEWDGDGAVLVCPDCGAANVPEGCPDCGAEMQVALGESDAAASDSPEGTPETVVVCPECDATAETPFRD